jgi:hypothetical protein
MQDAERRLGRGAGVLGGSVLTVRYFVQRELAARAAQTAARLREEIFEPVGHAQWVFTVPKMLRPYFLRHRGLLVS